MNSKNSQKGFTILVAVVTAGILLIIAMSIGGIALKEQMLSIANKDSQIAFYAADSGVECAMYWDQSANGGGKFVWANGADGGNNLEPISCNGRDISYSLDTGSNQENYSYTFLVPGIPVGIVSNNQTTCAVVKILKNIGDINLGQDQTRMYTTIQSYGYNTCAASLSRLERGITTNY